MAVVTEGSLPPQGAAADLDSAEELAELGEGVESPADAFAFADLIVEHYFKRGPHPEYQAYADSVRWQAMGNSAFDFVSDAVNGRGGFETGDYLDPHIREVDSAENKARSGTTGESLKFRIRRRVSDYDNFARPICGAYIGYIQQQQDEIKRTIAKKFAKVKDMPGDIGGIMDGLQEFWADVDRRGTQMSSFLQGPEWQTRMHGYSAIVVDRPQGEPDNAAEEADPEFRPYAYHVSSRNVVDWVLDDDGELVSIVILEPEDEERTQYRGASYGGAGTMQGSASGTGIAYNQRTTIRVWTRWSWSVHVPNPDGPGFHRTQGGEHKLGFVPVVMLYNTRPNERCLLGTSEMREVSLLAKTKYNLDSEIRELQRNTCFPFLWVPMKHPEKVNSLTISTMGATATDGDKPPAYVSPDTTALQSLRESAKEKVEQAYAMAHLAAVTGFVETTSGFHTQAEFDRTNRAISAFAANIEDAEKKIAWIYLRYRGVPAEAIDNGGLDEKGDVEEERPLFTITYPRNFNIQDPDLLVKRTQMLMALDLGPEATTLFIGDLLSSLYPKLPGDVIRTMAEASSNDIEAKKQEARDLERAQAIPAGAPPDRRAGMRDRVKSLAAARGKRAAAG